jgi:hypothetical protein
VVIFCDITPYSPLKINQNFEGTYSLDLQGQRISQARYNYGAGNKLVVGFSESRLILTDYTALYPGGRIFH